MSKVLRTFHLSGPVFLLSVVVFILFPFEIVINNREDIGNAFEILVLFAACAVGFVTLFFLLGTIMGEHHFVFLARICLAMSIYFMMSDTFAPVVISELETGTEMAEESWGPSLLQLGIGLVLVFAAFKISAPYLKIAWPIGIALIVLQVALALAETRLGDKELRASSDYPTEPTKYPGNIYQFVFDSYPGGWFPYVARALMIEDMFKDFVYFAHTRSNYTSTRYSVPSFTTGSVFGGGENERLQVWLRSQFERSNLRSLREEGFFATQYAPLKHFENPFAHVSYLESPVGWAFVADIVILRLAPTFLKKEVFYDGKGVVSRLRSGALGVQGGELRSYGSYRQFKQLLMHESARKTAGEFVFAHFYPPHPPYQLTRDGKLVEKSSFPEQVHLATNMMAEFISLLRKEGKYDSSFIIFQSDHGHVAELPRWLKSKNVLGIRLPSMSKERHLAMKSSMVGDLGGRAPDNRTRALLLVKLPGKQRSQYIVSDKLVQLMDLPTMISQVIKAGPEMVPSYEELITLLGREKVDVFSANRLPKDTDGHRPKAKIGRDVDEGHFGRYAVDEKSRWFREEKLFVRW